MLSKRPDCYRRFDALAPDNLWLGVTVTHRGYQEMGRLSMMERIGYPRWFVSFEPMHGALTPALLMNPRWVILGAETGNRCGRVEVRREWLDPWLEYRRPVFMKDSLIPIVGEENMRREYPTAWCA